jgi:hypothetical protein
LLKPSRGCGGAGIFIDSDLQSLLDHAALSSVGCWVAQKYLERPLLFHGRKFDLRVWVLVSSAPETSLSLWVRVYKEGYLRTSSQRYTLDAHRPVAAEANAQEAGTSDLGQVTEMSAAEAGEAGGGGAPSDGCPERRAGRKSAPSVQSKYDMLMHLTNHCQQRTAASLGRFEEGNTASYAALEKTHPELDLRGRVLPTVSELIASSILAARLRLLAAGGSRGPRVQSLRGYDFMLHQSGRPLLIEVNANPMLSPQAGWHDLLVRRLMHDYMQVALDPLFPPAAPPPPPPLDGRYWMDYAARGRAMRSPSALCDQGVQGWPGAVSGSSKSTADSSGGSGGSPCDSSYGRQPDQDSRCGIVHLVQSSSAGAHSRRGLRRTAVDARGRWRSTVGQWLRWPEQP